MRFFAFLAFALAALLVYFNYSGRISSLWGCGVVGGCKQVMGGDWSKWFFVPVSLIATGLHLTVLLLTLPPIQRWLSWQADRLLVACALLAVAAAFWFGGILIFVEKQFCAWCTAAHGLGLLWAVPVIQGAWRVRREEGPGFFGACVAVAVPLVALLVLGQIFGPKPDTHLITDAPATGSATPLSSMPHPSEAPTDPSAPGAARRRVSFQNGAFEYSVTELPLLGKADADHVLVEYFDYTCASCRDMFGDLLALKKQYPGKFAVVVLPCPLHRACNNRLPGSVPDHPYACELAQLALAVWRKAPAKFEEFHQFLMRLPIPLQHDENARIEARRLLGGTEELKEALADPWIKERLSETINQYGFFSAQTAVMPKLLLKEAQIMHGQARSEEAFVREMAKIFSLP